MPIKTKRDPAAKLRAKVQREIDWRHAMEKLPGVFIPIRANNPLNNRRHWRTVWGWSKKARENTRDWLKMFAVPRDLPAVVTMTRYGCGTLDAGCGLNASLKAVRDGVADHFGVDDADPRFTWVYKQEKSEFYGVRVEITP